MTQVAIISGSTSDDNYVINVQEKLTDLNISWESKVLSAHRNLTDLQKYIAQCEETNVKVFIALAGMAAALPGVIASCTDIPIIGVPLPGVLNGMDSLLSMVQMPAGVPVATMAIGKPGAINAAIFASKIINS